MSLSYAYETTQEPSGVGHNPSGDSGVTRHIDWPLWRVYRGNMEESVVCNSQLLQIRGGSAELQPPLDDPEDLPMLACLLNISGHKVAMWGPEEPYGPDRVQVSREVCSQKPSDIPRAILPGLMVFDCISEHVVTADPDCEYVALSYVWGARGDGGKQIFEPDLRGRRLPQTIQDAMEVVRRLKMRFLWVDRYCINSSEPATKHYMISNMDTIYARSCLTIIAAAGDNDKYGLPKIRCEKPLANIPPWNGNAFRDVPGYQLEIFKKSTWSTRGWTYQEGLLSRRQLVFTDAGVIFRHNTTNGVCTSSGIFAHINEYSRRKLTYPSDSLNAFLGVFRAYERLQTPVLHVWGVPFVFGTGGNMTQPGYGLLWKASSISRLQRIPGIPSWTWAGWKGFTRFPRFGPYDWLLREAPLDGPEAWETSDIAIEALVDGQLQTILEHFNLKRSLQYDQSETLAPVLFLTAWSTTLRFSVSQVGTIHFEDEDVGPGDFTLDEIPGVLSKSQAQPNGRSSCEWTVAIICWRLCNDTADNMRGLRTQSLLLERVGENTFRRIGILGTYWRKSDVDGQGRIAASGRTFTRNCLRIE